MSHQIPRDITWKLARSFLLPFWNDTFDIERRKLLLDAILELKIQGHFLIAMLVSQNGNRLARVMITVVKEEDDVSADFVLETSSRQNLSEQKSLGKKPARLLAETDDRVMHGSERVSCLRGRFRAAKHRLLQDRGPDQYGRASNEIIPEVTDVRCSEQDEHERLCN